MTYGFKEFHLKLTGMPDRKGSLADYWKSLRRDKIILLLEEQGHYSDLFMERVDKLEKKVNDLSRNKRGLEKEIIELKKDIAYL